MSTICFTKSTFLIGIIIMIVVIFIVDKHILNEYKEEKKKILNNKIQNIKLHQKKKYLENNLPNKHIIRYPNKTQIIYNRDQRALNDPLAPPTRRNPSYVYPDHVQTPPLEIPTRGYPDTYHYYGNLRRTNDGKVVKLFGRQTYPGSHEYEYYGITSDNYGSEIKIQIETKKREIYDGEEIDILFLDPVKGKFKLYMNDYDRPRYNPFLI